MAPLSLSNVLGVVVGALLVGGQAHLRSLQGGDPVCDSIVDERVCLTNSSCSWCESTTVPFGCRETEEAKKVRRETGVCNLPCSNSLRDIVDRAWLRHLST